MPGNPKFRRQQAGGEGAELLMRRHHRRDDAAVAVLEQVVDEALDVEPQDACVLREQKKSEALAHEVIVVMAGDDQGRDRVRHIPAQKRTRISGFKGGGMSPYTLLLVVQVPIVVEVADRPAGLDLGLSHRVGAQARRTAERGVECG